VNLALFLLIPALGVLSALGTVLARNLVHAALYLVAFFFTVACQFVLLEAEFLAALQVLVYIGAVSILMMFGIMLTRNIQGDDTTAPSNPWRMPALIAGLCVFIVLIVGINRSPGIRNHQSWSSIQSRPAIADAKSPRALAINGMARGVGVELMTRYLIAFEVAGVLLTAALVGAIALAYREDEPTKPEQDRRREALDAAGQPATAVTR
jgi:NADH-quinone oxidoreductase subunit J